MNITASILICHSLFVLMKLTANLVAGRTLRAADFEDNIGQTNNPDWKTVVVDANTDKLIVPKGTIGSRWGEEKNWNLESKDLKACNNEIWPEKSFVQKHDEVVDVCFPYFGNIENDQPILQHDRS